MYTVIIQPDPLRELGRLRAFDRNRILAEIDEQLTYEPKTKTKRKKVLQGLKPPWDQLGPVWQLRVEPFRVFNDVLEAPQKLVIVRAVRSKSAHQTTEDIL